jgi:hypothetical protein
MLLPLLLILFSPQDPAAAILGRWEGTSICIKAEWNRACHDEIAMHEFTRDSAHAGVIIDHGYKRVGDQWEWMADFPLRYDATRQKWSGDWSNSRVHIEVSYRQQGTDLVGTLNLLPDGRKGRDIVLHRPAPPAR